jgi:ParB family chromosome partitioning protein
MILKKQSEGEHVNQTAYQVTDLPVAAILPSPTNPRTHFADESLEELAASIGAKGVLEPVIVRPHPANQDRYELVAGERRWLASQKANKDLIPAIVRNLSDQEAREIQIIENLHRDNLHPLEEARGFCVLMESDPETYTVEEISARIGQKDRYVQLRLQLLKLTEDAQKLFAADRFSLAHAQELARLQPAHQQEALGICFRDFKSADAVLKDKHRTASASVRELREWIKSHCLLDLKTAPFDVRDETLVPAAGACINCPKRTGNSRLLFADLVNKRDVCSDPGCFATKKQALVQLRINELKDKGLQPARISSEYRSWSENEKGAAAKDVLYMTEYRVVEKGSCEFTQPGIYIDGGQFGKRIFICAHGDHCPVHSGRTRYASPEVQKKRKEQLQRQRVEKAFRWELLDAVKAKLRKEPRKEDLLMVALTEYRTMGHDNRRRVFKAYKWEEKKTKSRYGGEHVDYETLAGQHLEKMSASELFHFLIIGTLARDAYIPGYSSGEALATDTQLAQTATRYGIDLKELRRKTSSHLEKRGTSAK